EQQAHVEAGPPAVWMDRLDPDRHQISPRPRTMLPLNPPKPKPFVNAMLQDAPTGDAPTNRRSGSIGFCRLRFGCRKPWLSCSRQAIASMTPAALRQCPISDFVELTQTSPHRLPSRVLRA